jgi:hypothetical protein
MIEIGQPVQTRSSTVFLSPGQSSFTTTAAGILSDPDTIIYGVPPVFPCQIMLPQSFQRLLRDPHSLRQQFTGSTGLTQSILTRRRTVPRRFTSPIPAGSSPQTLTSTGIDGQDTVIYQTASKFQTTTTYVHGGSSGMKFENSLGVTDADPKELT